ncbi:MAG: hypothetical protein IJ438_11885 [Clostridia bacterium]|nr:hypothetical protein [Clostridia bacterium]
MTEQQERSRFHKAVDSTLSGLQGDPFLYQRIVAHTEKGAPTMKHGKLMKSLMIVLIAILGMSTVAVAAGVFGGTVNWNGDVIYDERPESAYPTMAPEMLDEQADYLTRLADWTAELTNDGELLVIYEMQEDGSFAPSTSNSLSRTTTNLATFRALLEGAENMPLPAFIPDGYEFVQGEVRYTCRAGGAWRLSNQMMLEEGVKAEWYQLDAADALICGYQMFFRDSPEDYHYLSISADLMELRDVSDQSFGFTEEETVQVVTVPGMDNAMAITSDHHCMLSMRRVLEEPIQRLHFRSGDWQEARTYGEVNIDVHAPLLDVDTLIRMFASE